MASHHHHRRIPYCALALAVILLGLLGANAKAIAEEPEPQTPPEAAAPKAAEKKEEKKEEKKAPELTAEEVDRLIGDLSSDDFVTRETAQKKLGEVTIASALAETMRQRYLRAENPELKLRLRRILYEVARVEFIGRKKAFLGIQMMDDLIVGGKTGREMILAIRVSAVISGSSAEEYGVQFGDYILSVNGKGFEAAPAEEFKGMIGGHAAGDTVKLKLRRGGGVIEKPVVLGEMPDNYAGLIGQSRVAFEPYFLLWLDKGEEIKRP